MQWITLSTVCGDSAAQDMKRADGTLHYTGTCTAYSIQQTTQSPQHNCILDTFKFTAIPQWQVRQPMPTVLQEDRLNVLRHNGLREIFMLLLHPRAARLFTFDNLSGEHASASSVTTRVLFSTEPDAPTVDEWSCTFFCEVIRQTSGAKLIKK